MVWSQDSELLAIISGPCATALGQAAWRLQVGPLLVVLATLVSGAPAFHLPALNLRVMCLLDLAPEQLALVSQTGATVRGTSRKGQQWMPCPCQMGRSGKGHISHCDQWQPRGGVRTPRLILAVLRQRTGHGSGCGWQPPESHPSEVDGCSTANVRRPSEAASTCGRGGGARCRCLRLGRL